MKPVFFNLIKYVITDPLDPITLPYLTIEKLVSFHPLKLFAAINSLSEHNFSYHKD